MVVTKGTRKQGRGVGRISHRTASWLAWSLCAVCVALLGLALLLALPTLPVVQSSINEPGPALQRPGLALALLTGVLSLAFPAVGALIASRLPANPIGWIFCGVGLLYTGMRFSIAYADYALLVNFAFPGGEYMAWFSTLVEYSGPILAGIFVVLLFPNGHLLSRRWQIVAWMAVLGTALAALNDAFYPGILSTHDYVDNPFGFVGAIGHFTSYELLTAAALVGKTLLLTSVLAAICSLFVRLHRAWGDERQQLKWFLYAAVPAGVGFSFILLSYTIESFAQLVFTTPLIPFWEAANTSVTTSNIDLVIYSYFRSVGVFALLVVPVFTYISILRYNLYDIDVVINRTLVYGALTA